ncbi:MAG TPA: transcriptional repressor [Acidobacteria bacterium]|nr:transcriptional repressor [Acidobacteriota bacterium]
MNQRQSSSSGGSVLVERMRAQGVRVTSPRRAIARVLETAEDHLDVEEITARARRLDPSVHRATVYRTLGLLKDLGLVDELDLLHMRGDRHFYEMRSGGQHAHVICTACGAVLEPGGAIMERCVDRLREATGYAIAFYRLEAGGLCPKCRTEGASSEA